MTNFEQGEIVLCNVDRIVGTTVFVNIEGAGEGRIVLSEIASGRIRNLREYVVPKKTIVCKILRISGDNVELSLRRVTPKEKKEVLEKNNIEKSYKSILKSILNENASEKIEEIKKESTLYEFIESVKEDKKKLEKYFTKEESEKIAEIINSTKPKTSTLKREIKLTTTSPSGLEEIKNILSNLKGIEIKYLSAGKYSLKAEEDDLKKADNKIKEVISNIEKEIANKELELKISV